MLLALHRMKKIYTLLIVAVLFFLSKTKAKGQGRKEKWGNMSKKVIGIATVALVVAAIAVGGFIFTRTDTSWYAKSGDLSVQDDIAIYYGTKGYDAASALWEGTGVGIWDADIGGVPIRKWIANHTAQQLERYLTIESLFDRNGLEFTAEELAEIDDKAYEDFWYYGLRAVYGPMGVEEEAYTEIVTNRYKAEKLITYYKSELSSGITDEDIHKTLSEEYASFIFVSMYYYDEEGNSAIEDYEALCQEVRDGTSSVEELAQRYADSDKNPLVTTSIGSNGDRIDLAIGPDDTSFPKAFKDRLFAAGVDEIIYNDDEGNYNYSISKRTDILEDDYYLEKYRDEIIRGFMEDSFEDLLWEKAEDCDISINNRNIERLDFKEILAKA